MKLRRLISLGLPLIVVLQIVACDGVMAADPIDRLTFGDAASEAAHGLTADADASDVVAGAMGLHARRLLPPAAKSWEGGRIAFTLRVDPERPTYVTARFWGGETNPDNLVLFCEGRQVGYRHLGDVDVLALSDDEPRYPGRFYYLTTPLPLAMTRGKTSVHLEIRASGPVWGYAANFEQYQKPMTVPSRAVYAVTTHVDACYEPPADEAQGEAPALTKRTSPGPEVMDRVKRRVNDGLTGLLKSKKPLNQMQLQFVARATPVKWTVAHDNPEAVAQVVRGVDELYRRFKADPDELWKDKAVWNPEWFGVGPAGDAVRLLADRMGAALAEDVGGGVTRRAAWSELFCASRDWLRTHQRWLANQAMFTATNLYLSNRAVAAIDPARALPEERARDYLYQAAGLVPFLGSERDGVAERPFGGQFYQVTDKGLSRELGYVGGYGEVGVAGVMDLYQATCTPGHEGDAKLKARLAQMQRARAPFRYPAADDDGRAAMRLETVVGWRDTHFPGPVVYTQPNADQSILAQVAATLDAHAVGYAQQMMDDDGQFFARVEAALKDRGFRTTFGLLSLPDDYETVRAQPPSPHRLPMTPGQPDFAWADEQAGVVAVKHGEEIFYASLYWRSRAAVNGLARVHRMTPRYQQVAVAREEVRFEPSGQTWRRPNWTNFGFANGGPRYPVKLDSALAGEELPVARVPADVAPGTKDNAYAGKAELYELRFGPYAIAMNTTDAKTFTVSPPAGVREALELVSGRVERFDGPVTLGPRSTRVWVVEAGK